SLKRILFLHTALKRSARHLLDPQVPLHRGIVLCRITHPHPLRRPLSQGVGLFGLLNSSSRLDSGFLSKLDVHLSSSRTALGRILSQPLTLIIITAVSDAGVWITLPRCAPRRDKLKGRLLAEMIRTRARGKPFKSDRADLISPTWLTFQKEHQLCRVHSP